MELEKTCLKNAKGLLAEAKGMLKRRKYAFATFFAITSFEETQKLRLLKMYDGGCLSEGDFNECWTSHVTKYSVPKGRIRVLIDTNDKVKADFGSEEEAQKIIKERNSCLYVDFSGNTIKSPKNITVTTAVDYINKANEALQTATIFKKVAKDVYKRLRQN